MNDNLTICKNCLFKVFLNDVNEFVSCNMSLFHRLHRNMFVFEMCEETKRVSMSFIMSFIKTSKHAELDNTLMFCMSKIVLLTIKLADYFFVCSFLISSYWVGIIKIICASFLMIGKSWTGITEPGLFSQTHILFQGSQITV